MTESTVHAVHYVHRPQQALDSDIYSELFPMVLSRYTEELEWTIHTGRRQEGSIVSESNTGRRRSVVIKHY